nr:hypothetical protein GCM10025732_05360 [Glycomyces mayteni]
MSHGLHWGLLAGLLRRLRSLRLALGARLRGFTAKDRVREGGRVVAQVAGRPLPVPHRRGRPGAENLATG